MTTSSTYLKQIKRQEKKTQDRDHWHSKLSCYAVISDKRNEVIESVEGLMFWLRKNRTRSADIFNPNEDKASRNNFTEATALML